MFAKLKQHGFALGLALITVASIAAAVWLTRGGGDPGQRLQAIAAVGSLVATASAAIFAAIQIGASTKAAQNSLATELPYLFIDPDLRSSGSGLTVTATNHGKSLCVASLVKCWSARKLPEHHDFIEGLSDDHLLMRTVGPGAHIEVLQIHPRLEDEHILGSLEYVNVFGGVQKTWFRFDLEDGAWTRRGGMHWNPSGDGKVRHHDDEYPKMIKPPPPKWPL